MIHRSVKITGNNPVALDMRELVFSWPEDAPLPVPGQFLTVRTTNGTDPLLRRPFAFSFYRKHDESSGDGTAAMIFQKRGKATELLCALAPGEAFDVIGPLGNSFPPPEEGRRAVLIAGGIGIGPVLFLAESLFSADEKRRPLVILGARNVSLLPERRFIERLKANGIQVLLCTDDGTAGMKGTVADAFWTLSEEERTDIELYACGPTPMLRAVSGAGSECGCPCHVSMEQMMACAVGACMGCVIRIRGEKQFARVCTEGPVFDADVIDWSAI